jgi:hypothetical protein
MKEAKRRLDKASGANAGATVDLLLAIAEGIEFDI